MRLVVGILLISWGLVSCGGPPTSSPSEASESGAMGAKPPDETGSAGPEKTESTLRDKLSRAQVVKTLRKGGRKWGACLDNANPRGVMVIKLTVQTSGKVSEAVVTTALFQNTRTGLCVRNAMQALVFPRFRQGPMEFSLPIKI